MSRSTIRSLNDAQRARMKPFADEWIRSALSTEPADWPLVEDGIRRCYEFAGLKWHGNVVRVSSPLAVSFAGPAAALILALRRSEDFRAAIERVVAGKRGASKAVDSAVFSAVVSAVDSAVGSAVVSAVPGAFRDALRGCWSSSFSGMRYGWWSPGTAFLRDVCGLDLPILERSRAYEAAQSAGWWWPHAEFTIVSDRPSFIARDEGGLLHSDVGPAIAWRDEWALHFIHGVRVTRQIVEFPESLTVAQIAAESNGEVKRIMIERFGAGRYLLEAGAQVIDMDARTVIGGAPRCLLRTSDGMQWLVGTDGSTERVYHMPVPSEVETCRAAHCAIAGLDEANIIMES